MENTSHSLLVCQTAACHSPYSQVWCLYVCTISFLAVQVMDSMYVPYRMADCFWEGSAVILGLLAGLLTIYFVRPTRKDVSRLRSMSTELTFQNSR